MKTKYKILMFILFLTFLTVYQIHTYNTLIEESGYAAIKRLYIPSVVAIIVVIIFSLLLNFNIIKPIERITGYIVDISHGELDTEIEPRLKESKDEIGELARAFDRTIVSLKLAMKMTAPELKKESDILKKALEEKEKAKKELQTSKNYIENIIRSMSDTLIVVNPDGTIQTVNNAALDLLGYTRDELTGRPIDNLIKPIKGKAQIIFKEIFKLGELVEKDFVRDHEAIYLTKDGREIHMSLSGSVMRDLEGNIIYIVITARDITERKQQD